MSTLEDLQAQVPRAFEEITRQTHVRPVSVGITRKGRQFAFDVSLPTQPETPGPKTLFGVPVVYAFLVSSPAFLGARKRSVG